MSGSAWSDGSMLACWISDATVAFVEWPCMATKCSVYEPGDRALAPAGDQQLTVSLKAWINRYILQRSGILQ